MYMLVNQPTSGPTKEAFEILDEVFGTNEFTDGQAVNALAVGLEVDNSQAQNMFNALKRQEAIGEVQKFMAYKLTGLGDSIAYRMERSKDPESAIMVYLYTHKSDSVEIDELVGELHTTETVVLNTIDRLVDKNYVKEIQTVSSITSYINNNRL